MHRNDPEFRRQMDELLKDWPQATVEKFLETITAHSEVGCGGLTWSAWPDSGVVDGKVVIDSWLVDIYEVPGEVVESGPDDGVNIFHGFSAVLNPLFDLFDAFPEVSFNCEVGVSPPEMTAAGKIDGQDFTVTIYACPPQDAEAGYRFRREGGTFSIEPIEDEEDDG